MNFLSNASNDLIYQLKYPLVIIDPNTLNLWPEKQWRILKHRFPETSRHREEDRWSRRKHPIQPILWEGAFGNPPRPPPPPPPPPPPAAASA